MLDGIDDGSLEHAIAEAAFRQQHQIETGRRVVVGVNLFRDEAAGEQEVELLAVPDEVRERQARPTRRRAADAGRAPGVERPRPRSVPLP